MEDRSLARANFILTLRNSNSQAIKVNYTHSSVINKEGTFRAFVKIGIPKSDFVKHLEDGFTGNVTYWKAFRITFPLVQPLSRLGAKVLLFTDNYLYRLGINFHVR